MRLAAVFAAAGIAASLTTGCGGLGTARPPAGDGDAGVAEPDASPVDDSEPEGELDIEHAQGLFATTTDLMRLIVAPGCAAERNECHSSEDFPDMSTEANLWNMRGLACNAGVGDRVTVDGFCEQLGDELRITDGANDQFTARIGSIDVVTDDDGMFLHYQVLLDTVVPQSQTDGAFEVLRAGVPLAPLGGGNSLTVTGGVSIIRITNADDLPDPVAVKQGDENRDGVFGNGDGALVKPGDAHASYLVRRLLGRETERVRMPLNANSDNPTEVNSKLTVEQMYAVMSWINCMGPTDGTGAAIVYDCAANADNDGTW